LRSCALFAEVHLLRNIGSSFFISMCVAEIVRTTAQNYSRLNETISLLNNRLTLPWVMGGFCSPRARHVVVRSGSSCLPSLALAPVVRPSKISDAILRYYRIKLSD
jgi:hypothetical protein